MVGSPAHAGYQVFRFIYEPQGRNYQIDVFEIVHGQGKKPIDLEHHIVRFDSLGRCIEQRDIDSDGEFNGGNTYEYDNRGDPIREVDQNSDGNIRSVQDRTYSPDRKLLSEKGVNNQKAR